MSAGPAVPNRTEPGGASRVAALPALPRVDISVVIPMHDEEDNVRPLHEALSEALKNLGRSYEVIVVDDGSEDATFARLEEVASLDPAVKLVKLRRNFGQTAAMAAGFDHARGSVIVPMDGDLQNDPADIPRLLEKLDEGYDVVSRLAAATGRTPSAAAAPVARRQLADRPRDRRPPARLRLLAEGVPRATSSSETRLYGEMHRFIPLSPPWPGPASPRSRSSTTRGCSGERSTGIERTVKVVLDLMTVKFLLGLRDQADLRVRRERLRPARLFGVIALGFTAYERWVDHRTPFATPRSSWRSSLLIIGINLILMGLLAELIIRTYHESQAKPTYWVRELRNFDEPPPLPSGG